MYDEIFVTWDQTQWDQAYDELHISGWRPKRAVYNGGEKVALKTLDGQVHLLEVPDFTDHPQREALENAFLEKLKIAGQTQVLLCWSSLGSDHPDMISANLRQGLLALDKRNLDTRIFLWGGAGVHAKRLGDLLPPEK